MATRILFFVLALSAIVTLMPGAGMAATLFEDDFLGTTLDTSKWTPSGDGTSTVTVADGNVVLNASGAVWSHSQIDSKSTWNAGNGDLYYSFKIGAEPQGNYNIMQLYEGTAEVGYVAMRNDTGMGWVFDVREAAMGSAAYHSTLTQTLEVGDVFTLRIGPAGSAAYKNGRMFDSTEIIPTGELIINAQAWLGPGEVASQTFDYICVSDTAPIPEILPIEPLYQYINIDFNGTRIGNPDPITYQPADGTFYNGVLIDSRNDGITNDDNLTISAANLRNSKGVVTDVDFWTSPVGGEQAPAYVNPGDPSQLEALNSDYLFVQANANTSNADFTISGLGDVETINILCNGYRADKIFVDGATLKNGGLYDVPVVNGEVHGVIGDGTVVVLYNMAIEISQGYPKPGDANRDSVVNEDDAQILAQNWLQTTYDGWIAGDFNLDAVVNDIDAALMAANWTGSSSASVPEPSTAVLILAGVAAFLLRKRG